MPRQRGNGCGNITRIKGKKKKPYRVRITVGYEYDEQKEKQVQRVKNLGYFQTRQEAEKALVSYHASPYDLSEKVITFEDLYQEWSKRYFKTLKNRSSERTVEAAYKYCSGLYYMKLCDINVGHLQDCMEEGYVIVEKGKDAGKKKYASACTKQRMKSMFNLMFDYAVNRNLVQDNVARRFKISDAIRTEAERNRKEKVPFSKEEIDILWRHVEMGTSPFADMILIGIYTGFRPSEVATLRVENVFLDENKLIGGMKTEAGTDREVPIHPCIKPLIEKRYYQATEIFQSEWLFNDARGQQGTAMTYDKFRRKFEGVLRDLGMCHTGHEMRHTFATLAHRAGMDRYAIKKIIGHRPSQADLLESVYTHITFEDLYQEILKIPAGGYR